MDLDNELNTYRSSCVGQNVTAINRPDEASESVDLLQMIPDASRMIPSQQEVPLQQCGVIPPCGTIPQYAKSRSLDSNSSSRRMRFVLVPGEEQHPVEADVNPGIHVCQGCRDSEMYYHTMQRSLRNDPCPSRTAPERTNPNDDGSVYFNYLRFANTSTRTSPGTTASSTYEPVTQSAQSTKCNPFKCCLKRKTTKLIPTKAGYTAQSSEDPEEVLETRKEPDGKSRDWRRIKRLLLLAGVLLGILVALGGMVVGFLVLSPKHTQDGVCNKGYILCGKDKCVLSRHVCSGHVDKCTNPDINTICSSYNSSRMDSADSLYTSSRETNIAVSTEMEKPIKDLSGWVYYSKGSVNGSRYMVINRAMTFFGGQEECRRRGGYLAHVNHIREQVFIEEYLKQELLNPDISQDGVGFWLGARRARGSHSGTCMYDQWKWVDSYGRQHGIISGFGAFVPNKPDNYFNPEECLYLSYENKAIDSFLKWDDAPCDIHSVGGIKVLCEAEN